MADLAVPKRVWFEGGIALLQYVIATTPASLPLITGVRHYCER